MATSETSPNFVEEFSGTSAILEAPDLHVGRLAELNPTNVSDDSLLAFASSDHSEVFGSLPYSGNEDKPPALEQNAPAESSSTLSNGDQAEGMIDDSIMNPSRHEDYGTRIDACSDIIFDESGPCPSQSTIDRCGQDDVHPTEETHVLETASVLDTEIGRSATDQPSNDLSIPDTPPVQNTLSKKHTDITEQLIICPECDLTFANDISLKAHQLTHKEDSRFVCGICGNGFDSERLLSSHFATHSESRRYTCPDCRRIFRNLLSFQQHEKLHKIGRMFTCKHCGKAFQRQSILQKHRYSHMKKVRIEYACEQCSECFSTVTQLQQHERKVHLRRGKGVLGPTHKCEECGESFHKENQLREHLQQHVVQRENFCKDCGRDYSSPTALQNHRCFRARRPSFTCKDCGRRFTKKEDVLEHERTHLENEREYDCNMCFESFTSRAELKVHTAVHRRSPSFECRHCGKQFKKKGFLTNHEKTHANQRQNRGRKSKSMQSDAMGNHASEDIEVRRSDMRHESVFIKTEGMYRCLDCGKTFRQKGQTIYHQKKETNMRTFLCPKCPNSYLTSAHLKAHMLTHSTSKALKCDGCGREFNYKSNLTSHLKKCPQISGRAITKRPRRYNHQAKLSREEGIDDRSEVSGDNDEEETEEVVLDRVNDQDQMQHQCIYNEEIELYQCQDCSQTFKQKGQTLYHQKKVNNKRQFACKICSKAFLTSPHLKAHELVHTTEKPLICDGCGKGFNYKCNLKTHQRNGCLGLDPEGELALSKMKLYKCNECGKEFKLKMYFEKHQKMHERRNLLQDAEMDVLIDIDEMGQRKEHRSDYNEEEGTYKCRDCDMIFKQSGQALYHFRKYSNERNFVCKVCPKSFLTSAHLKSHIMSHTKEKPYKCWYCGKGFNHNSNRKYHQSTSCNERPPPGEKVVENNNEKSRGRDDVKKPITCAVCNKQFMLTHSWKVHMRVHTREQPFLCEYCGKAFRCRSNLYVHRNSHTKERPYLCNFCGKNFAQLSHVRVHEAIHNTEKPHKCSICGKSFNQEFYLKRHKVMHTDDRPFVCFCGKSFKYRGSLVSHKATHSTKRPYGCHLCDKAFKQSCHLKVHILTHGELKPFKCDKCQKAFIRKNQLSRHQRSHSDERGYVCSLCGKDFKHSSSMKRHQERKHNKDHSDTSGNTTTTTTTTTTNTQPVFDSVPYTQPPSTVKKNVIRVNKTKTQWPAAVDRASIEQGNDNQMHITVPLETRVQPSQHVDNRVITQMDGRLTAQPVDCRMTSQPIDYRVSPQLTDPCTPPHSSVSGHLTHLSSGHPVYSEAQYIQGPEFASVHLPHIGTFDFRTNTTGSVDYTIL